MRNEDLLHEAQQDRPDRDYDAVRDYRVELDWIVEKARRHFKGCVVTWSHANIYRHELLSVPLPGVPGYDNAADLTAAVDQIRGMVTDKIPPIAASLK